MLQLNAVQTVCVRLVVLQVVQVLHFSFSAVLSHFLCQIKVMFNNSASFISFIHTGGSHIPYFPAILALELCATLQRWSSERALSSNRVTGENKVPKGNIDIIIISYSNVTCPVVNRIVRCWRNT